MCPPNPGYCDPILASDAAVRPLPGLAMTSTSAGFKVYNRLWIGEGDQRCPFTEHGD